MCELLVGLPAITVLAVDDNSADVVVHIESRLSRPGCPSCGTPVWVRDRPVVELVDLPCFGRPARLVWHKHRWCCSDADCRMGSWTGEDDTRPAGVGSSGDIIARDGRW